MKIRLLLFLGLLALVGCSPAAVTLRGTPAELSALRSNGGRSFTAGDVVTWAQLDDHFRDQTVKLTVGQADGKALLGRLVLLENGAEAADFLKAHGCAQLSARSAYASFRPPCKWTSNSPARTARNSSSS
jgi:hypothetical protein